MKCNHCDNTLRFSVLEVGINRTYPILEVNDADENALLGPTAVSSPAFICIRCDLCMNTVTLKSCANVKEEGDRYVLFGLEAVDAQQGEIIKETLK